MAASMNQAGVIKITIEHATDLKRCDLFTKQDPYFVLKCGCNTFTSRTVAKGGRHPVWNETATFEVVKETHAEVTIMDEDDHSSDDLIGTCVIPFANARAKGVDHMQIPVTVKSNKHRGFISVRMTYESKAPHMAQQQQQQPASQPHTIGYALMPCPMMPGAPMMPGGAVGYAAPPAPAMMMMMPSAQS